MTTTAELTLRRVLDLADGPTFPADWLLGTGVLAPDETVLRVVPGTGAWYVRSRDLLVTDRRILLVKENILRRGYTVTADVPLAQVTEVVHRGFLVTWFTARCRGRTLRVWHPEDDAATETAQAVTRLLTTGTLPAPPLTRAEEHDRAVRTGTAGQGNRTGTAGASGAQTRAEASFWAAARALGTHMAGQDLDALPATVLHPEETVVRIIVGASGGEDARPLLVITDGRVVLAAKNLALHWVTRREIPLAAVTSARLDTKLRQPVVIVESSAGKPAVMLYNHRESAAEAVAVLGETVRTGQLPGPPADRWR